jgi:glycosyltransferase involved in cell wall biosynthesis
MSTVRPFFSVVMPTYNRAHLLPLAIESVLQQSVTDFELIISNGGSTDNTRDAVAGFSDKRIRYFETQEKLSIGDNYQYALQQANGEYITFLGDDDAFAPIMFERVERVITERQAQVVAFQYCNYYHNEYIDDDFSYIHPNTLQIPQFTGETFEFKSADAIKHLFRYHGLNNVERNQKFIVPFLANAVYHNGIFSRIQTKTNNPFAATPADMYMAAAVFYVTKSYFCLDEPLHVWSRWSGSTTTLQHKKGNEFRRHYEKLLNGQTLPFTPLKLALPHNCSINAVLQAEDDFVDADYKSEIDWVLYYKTIYENLMYLKSIEVDITQELSEFQNVLLQESVELRQKVNLEISRFSVSSKRFLRNNLPFVFKPLKKLLDLRNPNKSIMIRGIESGFNNVFEAACFLGNSVANGKILNESSVEFRREQ